MRLHCLQERQCLLDGEVGATEVGIENIIKNVLGRFCNGAQFGYPRVRVEDINPSVLLTDLLEQRIKLVRLRDIGCDRDTIGADLVLSIAYGLRTVATTLAPSLMNCFAAARPIPLVPSDDDDFVREAAHGVSCCRSPGRRFWPRLPARRPRPYRRLVLRRRRAQLRSRCRA